MYQEQGHLPDRTSVRRDTGTGLRVRGVHGLSVLPDIEAVMQLDHLYRPALRLPCHELRKQPEKGIDYLQRYLHIHCYLDNDLAGQKTVETIAGLYGERVSNEAVRYSEYKDLNDCLRGKKR